MSNFSKKRGNFHDFLKFKSLLRIVRLATSLKQHYEGYLRNVVQVTSLKQLCSGNLSLNRHWGNGIFLQGILGQQAYLQFMKLSVG